MKIYKGIGHDSGITRFEARPDSIILQFRDRSKYLYNYVVPGRKDVEAMKRLATRGLGLTTYVNQHVRERYAEKL